MPRNCEKRTGESAAAQDENVEVFARKALKVL